MLSEIHAPMRVVHRRYGAGLIEHLAFQPRRGLPGATCCDVFMRLDSTGEVVAVDPGDLDEETREGGIKG